MKKIVLLLLLLFISQISFADTVIQMEPYGGVYRIPCLVNGAKMKFIFDTGASNVCLSITMAEYLYDNGYIEDEDILGKGSSSVADGRIVDHIKINLKDIEISGIHLYNVQAIVIEGQNAPLLMGQSAIQKLGSIEINGNILIIKNDNMDNNDLVDKLFSEARDAYENNLYEKAVEKYGLLYQMDKLSDYGKYIYANACMMTKSPQKTISILNDISTFDYFENEKIDIYRLLGFANADLEKYEEAVAYMELSSNKIQTEPKEWANNFMFQGDYYRFMKHYSEAAEKYLRALQIIATINNVDVAYLQNDCKNQLKKNEKSYRNDNLDYIFYYLIENYYYSGTWTAEGFLSEAAALARAGNKYAIQMFNITGINPYSGLW